MGRETEKTGLGYACSATATKLAQLRRVNLTYDNSIPNSGSVFPNFTNDFHCKLVSYIRGSLGR